MGDVALTGFLLSASVATPLVGKLGDQYGKERLLVISLSIFFLGSVAAVFAPGIGVLIACRILQGVGAAVFPLSFSIIRDEFPREKVPIAVGAVSSVFAIGGGLGLVLSGVILDSFSWRWIFGLGAVAVAIAVVLVHLFVPESPIKTPSRVDVIGGVLLSAGLVALLLGLTEGERWGWSSGADRRSLRRRRRAPGRVGPGRSCGCPSRWSTCGCSPGGRSSSRTSPR